MRRVPGVLELAAALVPSIRPALRKDQQGEVSLQVVEKLRQDTWIHLRSGEEEVPHQQQAVAEADSAWFDLVRLGDLSEL